MAFYDKLLLSKGGGIIPMQHMIEQIPNTATLLIGLGGTGIDCISLIKEKVQQMIMPDDPLDAAPSHSHIRFLGIDTDNAHVGLDNSEYFSVACNTSIKARFSNQHINKIPYLSWLNRDAIAPHITNIGNSGHGIRQVGRFLMMDKSADFIERLDHEIHLALDKLNKRDQYEQPTLNIHIMSGLAGSIGSGSFLDVCYMVRYVAKRLSANVNIYGDFFLPDVNLSRIPSSNSGMRDILCMNGYAAMQELDYCMRIAKNGGTFTQEYQGHHQIKWDGAPVDICNLIGSTDSTHRHIYDAYYHALNVTSEYVIALLTQADLRLMTNLAAQRCQSDASKTAGAEVCYHTLGAANVSVPAKEILTYLSTQLFECFKSRIKTTISDEDVSNLSKDIFATSDCATSTIYSNLVNSLRDGVPEKFSLYRNDWRFVRDYENSELVLHYTNQTSSSLTMLDNNGKQLLESLNTRINETLSRISSDVTEGPLFLMQLLSQGGDTSILRIIDILIQENNHRWSDELAQKELRHCDYESAKADFDHRRSRSLLDTDEKRFSDYEYTLYNLESHKVTVRTYEILDHVLKEYRRNLFDLSETIFQNLSEITVSLIETFDSNTNFFSINSSSRQVATSLITLEHIRPELDMAITQIDISDAFKGFISNILENLKDVTTNTSTLKPSACIDIPAIVSDYCFEIFKEITARYTVDSLLKKCYPNLNDEQLANAIYQDIYKKLDNQSAPLYPCSPIGGFPTHVSEVILMRYPKSSVCNSIAARQMQMTDPRFMLDEGHSSCQNTSENHISCVRIQCGLPLCSYDFITDYERIYFGMSSKPGCHLYDGLPEKNITFTDWKKLPSVIPFSLTDKTAVHRTLADRYNIATALFMNAYAAGIIDITGQIYEFSESNISTLQSLCEEASSLMFKAKRAQDAYYLENVATSIRSSFASMLTTSNMSLGLTESVYDEETTIRILMDYFIASPAIHDYIVSQVTLNEQAKLVKERATSVLDGLEMTIGELKSNAMTRTRTIWEDATGYDDWDEEAEDDLIYDIPIANMSEKYIFISYAHKDSDIVLPILRRMSWDGYVIWYDNHIAAASEWDDSIAEHIENSSYVISFISRNYMESENCMDELKYARDEKKKPLLVFLEDLSLRGGLAMRLNRLQHIHHFKFTNAELFFRKLYEAEGINVCHKK